MAAFPPGRGGGEGVEHGHKGKGVTIHSLVDAQGMPLSISVTPANASEREQTIKMLDAIKIKTGRRGRPKTRPKQLAADKGYDSRELRKDLRARGIRPEIAHRVWPNRRKRRGRKLKRVVARFVVERTFSWYQRKFRRLTTRWERKSKYFDSFVFFGFICIWVEKILGLMK
jgi:transposase